MNASPETERMLGEMLARIRAMETQHIQQAKDIREVRDALLKAKGGWKTLMAVGAIGGGMGAFLAKVAPFLLSK